MPPDYNFTLAYNDPPGENTTVETLQTGVIRYTFVVGQTLDNWELVSVVRTVAGPASDSYSYRFTNSDGDPSDSFTLSTGILMQEQFGTFVGDIPELTGPVFFIKVTSQSSGISVMTPAIQFVPRDAPTTMPPFELTSDLINGGNANPYQANIFDGYTSQNAGSNGNFNAYVNNDGNGDNIFGPGGGPILIAFITANTSQASFETGTLYADSDLSQQLQAGSVGLDLEYDTYGSTEGVVPSVALLSYTANLDAPLESGTYYLKASSAGLETSSVAVPFELVISATTSTMSPM